MLDIERQCSPKRVVPRTLDVVERMNITLDNERSEKLARLAARTGAHRVTVVNSLLACAIDQADPDAGSVVELLDGIDGAYERATLGSGRRTAATRCRPTRCS